MHLGVTFDGLYHTGRDWNLHFASLQIDEPDVQTYQLTVPGRDGILDLTESLFGRPTFLNRTITMNFWTEFDRDGHLQFVLMNALHGKRMEFSLDIDPGCYWTGRLSVHVQKTCPAITEVVITADCEAYKSFYLRPTENILWDDINFDRDILENFENIEIPAKTTKKISVTAGDNTLSPVVTTSKNMQVTVNGEVYNTVAGTPLEIPVTLYQGVTVFSILSTTSGTLTLEFKGRSL